MVIEKALVIKSELSLKNFLILLSIVVILLTPIGSLYVVHDNSKQFKTDIDGLKLQMTAVEKKQIRFEGIIEERTRNTQSDIREIKTDVKTLLNRLRLTVSETKD